MKKATNKDLKKIVLNNLEPHKERIQHVLENAESEEEVKMYLKLYFKNILEDSKHDLVKHYEKTYEEKE